MSTDFPEFASRTESDEPMVSLAALAAEQAGAFESGPITTLPSAPGDPMLTPGDVAELFTLAMVALAEPPGPSGSEMVPAYEETVGTSLSPGTLYPRLHELDEAGLIAWAELSRHKRYQIVDGEAADAVLAAYEKRLEWWLRVCRTARETIDTDDDSASEDSSDETVDTWADVDPGP